MGAGRETATRPNVHSLVRDRLATKLGIPPGELAWQAIRSQVQGEELHALLVEARGEVLREDRP